MNLIKMFKYLILLITITVQFSFATTYYVDAINGNDNNSGLSTSTAWRTINKINNFTFSANDIISFKCGERFTGYTLTPPQNNLTFTSYGSGAKPIIDGQSTIRCVDLGSTAPSRSYITFNNLKFVHGNPANIDMYNSSYITIEYCNVDSSSGNSTRNQDVYSGKGSNLIVRYSTLNYAQACSLGGHGIYIDGTDNSLFEYDTLIYNGNDGIRIGYSDSSPWLTDNLIVRYCVVRFNGDEIISDDGSTTSQYYYNIFENQTSTWSDGISLFSQGGYYPSGNSYYNNTFIIHDPGSNDNMGFDIKSSSITNMTVKNNIFYLVDNIGGWAVYNTLSTSGNWSFNNNVYFRPNGSQSHLWHWGGTTQTSFSNWQSFNFDLNGTFADPLFNNFANSDYSLKSSSPAINEGISVGLTKDILGNLVPNYKPDAGAIEHLFVQTNIKTFLSGPFNNGSMTTFLNTQHLIPLNQPYSSSPWAYSGSESVQSIPSNVVDWILVELRTTTSSSTTISRRAAFIKNDGTVVDLDGISELRFDFVNNGNYYLVIRHRNHLAIMSSSPVLLSSSSSLYDFTTSQSKAYGTNPMMSLGSGLYGMYSGDGDANGGISSTDRNNIWRVENGTIGYFPGDYDLSGGVNSTDLNLCWRLNNGTLTQVP